MDKGHAEHLLNAFGHPVVETKDGKTIGFYRCNSKVVAEIEKMTNEELVKDYINHIWICYGPEACISVSDIQYRYLLEAELHVRKGIDHDKLKAEWEEIHKAREEKQK